MQDLGDKQNIIEVDQLVKKYKDFTAVDRVSFGVRKGEIFAFLGPNGAGKTTTISILTTLLKPTLGRIRMNGCDPVREQAEARRSFGIVFQDPSLDEDLTARENMQIHAVLYSVPRTERKSKIQELLEFVELWDRRDALVKNFSGGMKRRLEIARGLLHQPQILFLDEPTLGLDPQTRIHIWDYIKRMNRESGMTVFFTTHYIEEADKMAERAAIIDHGRIVATGSPSELKQQTGTGSLESAFLKLTGKDMRAEQGSAQDRMRRVGKVMKR